MVARAPNGETKSFPSALNHHENQILVWSVIPSSIPADLEAMRSKIARGDCAMNLSLEGLLAVEMFVTKDGDAAGQRAGSASAQQLSRERAGLRHQPVRAGGARGVRSAAGRCAASCGRRRSRICWAMSGWLERRSREPRFDRALAIPGVSLHLYEKHKPRKGRKMGHLSAVGATPDEAIAQSARSEAAFVTVTAR